MKVKKPKRKRKEFDINDLESMDIKQQGFLFSILSKNKGIVFFIVVYFLLSFISIMLSLLLTFKII